VKEVQKTLVVKLKGQYLKKEKRKGCTEKDMKSSGAKTGENQEKGM